MSIPDYRDHIAVECFKAAFAAEGNRTLPVPEGMRPEQALYDHWRSAAVAAFVAASAFQHVLVEARTTLPQNDEGETK